VTEVATVQRATMTSEDFERGTEQMRRELLAHCYQMLGSFHDAEDLVQETMLRAWRARSQFDARRASLRTWLYRIATNACLTALAGRARRPLPSGIGAPSNDPQQPLVGGHEVPWLQPFPDSRLDGDPAAALLSSGRLRLALVAAMQLLPARQRAILILRDALELPAAEVAQVLDTSQAAVNSGLQRARARIAAAGLDEYQLGQPADAGRREVVEQYVAAFRNADVARLKLLVAQDAILEMPPFVNWYAGRDDYLEFIARVFAVRGTDWQMLPLSANGQPAVGAYVRGPDGSYLLHTLQVFSVAGGRVDHTVVFADQAVFDLFGLTPGLTPLPAGVLPPEASAVPREQGR
jgi:RNA polymerase sigma-70 factor, ECF subfamily